MHYINDDVILIFLFKNHDNASPWINPKYGDSTMKKKRKSREAFPDPRENLTAGEVLYPDWNGPEKIEEAPSLTPVNPLDHARNQSQPSVADILYLMTPALQLIEDRAADSRLCVHEIFRTGGLQARSFYSSLNVE
ncbi:MAG: hypothetical protein QGF09_05230, partial [Rhodospirillales bacterium]|nr:hypothetical protein [Rhodospirillales bacterium]